MAVRGAAPLASLPAYYPIPDHRSASHCFLTPLPSPQKKDSMEPSIPLPEEHTPDVVLVDDTPAPVSKADRIQAIDMVRGFALLGILLMNIIGFSTHFSNFRTIIAGPQDNPDYLTLAIISILPEGTMRGLFSMLFGVGMILFTLNKHDHPGGPSVAAYYYRRLLWLVLFGVFNAFVLLWQGDILFYYGLTGMLLFPFRKMSAKGLLLLGLFCFVINGYKTQSWYGETREKRLDYLEAKAAQQEKKKLTDQQQAAIGTWEEIEKSQQPDTANVNRHLEKMHGSYATIFTYYIPRVGSDEPWGMYHGIWDFMGMMLIGMALFWMGFFNPRFSISNYVMLLAVGYGIGIVLGYIVFVEGQTKMMLNFTAYIDAWRSPHFMLYDVRRLLISLGHASLLMLIFRSGILKWLMRALANVGQMAFTNYLMQSIICTWVFYGYGADFYNRLRFHQVYYVVFAIWIFQIIFSAIWLRYFRFGPFEWVWRSLTYWKRQPWRTG
jgi:uncharacterized protein